MSSSNTDFDATLVDWLYGELDADAVASFEAHLETHPEHKAEAHALRETRVAFQGLPEAEPSNALTSMLMQQAAVAAQPKQGMWAAVVGFFQPVFMHPAAMAMATVVVVAGVAGTLYLRNGKMVAETTVASSSEAPPSSVRARGAAEPAPVTTTGLGDQSELSEGEMAKDDSESPDEKPAERALDQGFAADLATPAQEKSLRAAKEEADEDDYEYRQSDNKNRKDKSTDVLSAADGFGRYDDMSSNAISGGVVGSKLGSTKGDLKRENVSKPEPKTESVPKAPGRRARSTSTGKVAKKAAPTQKPPAWEDKQVASFQTAARGKRCRDAGRIANDLRDKNPLVYDRDVKGTPEESDCSYYITSESKRRKMARKKALAKSKSKAKRKKGQGKSVPKNAVAAPQEDSFEADAPAQTTENGL